ncbi:winged helix-turn-helix domain-containing protein [Paenibacillus brevis]|uniref:Winged helix-turn-helix domain-containing protein n=1 Tax=Paenibacillus brevis TaxID=2841508 RepID=A0ABS6FLE1_9BACL|nr:winged helix-turn-helix domain-containing protein [Paenibacillus brevis]MBU5671020.1 winged helix-turn-helix domain-containing protein [Paenibacillus brevis]
MAQLVFDPAGYTVNDGTESVELLAKEFALLQFLYEQRGRAFSREQLLDRVWVLEYPVERTVDDHIYRLRKKLRRWAHVQINTIRGYGYSLIMAEPKALDNPSMRDEEIRNAVRGLFEKYHLLGQGKSIVALAAQREVLGFEIDAFYRSYIRFIQADIGWFLETDEVPPRERFYWLLLLYWAGTPDYVRVLDYCEEVLRQGLMTPEQHREMEILNILEMYADAGKTKKAIERFDSTRRVVEQDGLTGFVMPVALMEMYVHLVAENWEEADQTAARLERLLEKEPYIREIGRFRVFKGLRLLAMGQEREAEENLDEGLEILGMSQHQPLYLAAIKQINLFLRRRDHENSLVRKYAGLFESVQKEYRLSTLGPAMEEYITEFLGAGTVEKE